MHSCCQFLNFHQQFIIIPVVPYPYQCLVCQALKKLNHLDRYIEISYLGNGLYFPIAHGAQHFFMYLCLLGGSIYKIFSQIFSFFSYMISLCILIEVCLQVCVLKYFIPIWDLYFLQRLLKNRKFTLINSNLSFFVLLIASFYFWS